jgi:hypothetical protein
VAPLSFFAALSNDKGATISALSTPVGRCGVLPWTWRARGPTMGGSAMNRFAVGPATG